MLTQIFGVLGHELAYWSKDKYFADDNLKCIFLNEGCIFMQISLKFVMLTLVQVIAPSRLQAITWASVNQELPTPYRWFNP